MQLAQFLIRYFLIEIHKRYFLVLGRSIRLLSHYFGLSMMLRSLFKPLFGMNGFLSRVNGVVIRSLSIVLASILIVAYSALGLFLYFGFYAFTWNLIRNNPFYLILIVVGLLILGLYRYYFFSPFKIKNGNVELKVNWQVEAIYSSLLKGKTNVFLRSIENNSEIENFTNLMELNYIDLSRYINSTVDKFSSEKFNSVFVGLQDNGVFIDKRFSLVDILCAYILHTENPEFYLNKFNLGIGQLTDGLKYFHFLNKAEPKIWDDEFLVPPAGGIDKGWAISYTPMLNKYGMDLTKMALKNKDEMPVLIGRDDVKSQVIGILQKPSRNNVLLLGEAGVGKSTFVKALAREIAVGTNIPALRSKRIVSLDIAGLMSGSSGELNKRITEIAKESAIAGNIILFIDEIQTASSDDPNSSALFTALEPYLSDSKFQFIGTTSRQNYLKYIKPNESFSRTFDIVDLRETSEAETLLLLEEYAHTVAKNTIITFPSIDTAFKLSKKYVNDRAMPDKAISLLNQVYSEYNSGNNSVINKNNVLEFVSKHFHIPVETVSSSEKETLLNLESIMHEEIVGQDNAITLIVKALKRARVGIRNEEKPLGSFLFAGPTGVGKTETAKVLAKTYFGSADQIIRVDMSEYQTADSVSRLIGDNRGTIGYLISKIQSNPHSLILLDEIEKADKNVLNLFLQVLDEGRLTDGVGKTHNFSNTFIIMTTNVGTKSIINEIKANSNDEAINDIALAELKEYFPLEFLNRFTAVVPYAPLSQDDIQEITKIKLNSLKKKIFDSKKIKIEFSDEIIEKIGKMAYSPEWGARELNRVIEDKVETLIAEKIIAGEVNPGDTYKFDTLV